MKRRIMMAMFCVGILGGNLSWATDLEFSWQAPPEAREKKNPIPADNVSLQRGKPLYDDNCQMCHGDTGKGDGPMADTLTKHPGNLSAKERMDKLTDGELFWRVSAGDAVMPSFEKDKPLTEQQRWDIINYIRTLASPKGP